jgi:hypothetical protein
MNGLPPEPRSPTPADALVRQATTLASEGRLADAARLYEQAAGVHRRAHRTEDEAWCLALLAQSRRLAGDLHGAHVAVGRARRLARAGGRAAVAAATEKAEVDAAQGDFDGAVLALDDAISWHEVAPPALLRRRAMLNVGRGRAADADADFAEAARLLEATGEGASARRVLVERATALHNLGGGPALRAALAEARERADAAGDHSASGDLDLLEAAAAVADHRLGDAEMLTLRARERALAAVEPVLYVGATLALSELAEIRGDFVSAYEALAVGWATLGDLVGKGAAAEVFRPRMEGLEARLGAPAFAAARTSYEERRRRELGRTPLTGG